MSRPTTSDPASRGHLRLLVAAAAILLGVLVIEAPVYGNDPLPEAMQHPIWVPVTAAALAAVGLLMWGVPRLAAAQGGALSRAGRGGATAASIGFFLTGGMLFLHTFISPVLAADHPEAYAAVLASEPPPALLIGFAFGRLALYVGLIVFGVAAYRARTAPLGSAFLVGAGSLVALLTSPIDKSIVVGGIIQLLPVVGLVMMSLAVHRGRVGAAPATHTGAPIGTTA